MSKGLLGNRPAVETIRIFLGCSPDINCIPKNSPLFIEIVYLKAFFHGR